MRFWKTGLKCERCGFSLISGDLHDALHRIRVELRFLPAQEACHPVAELTLRASILIALRRKFLNLPYGSLIALRLVVVFRTRKERCQCRLPIEN